ncbi:MAG: DNA repair protein RecN [Erysipelotrichaceae bacterium]|nr:DNA repair protein RecN [Erysipelotrichaceae bacterium]
MLKSLYIKNYAIIDELNIDFDDGFNVFTGETGAGKSIIVGALSCLVKGKADPSLIRGGCDKAVIEGVFSVDDYMKETLDEAAIDYDDDLIVRRVISRDNRNTIKVNQANVTLNFLSNLFGEHIDIHSQKDSQYLLNKKNHLLLLDKYAHNQELLTEYREAYKKYDEALNEYNDLQNNTYNEADLEYYRYDLKELEDAHISLNEEDELETKEKRYKDSEKFITSLKGAIETYEGENGIDELLSLLDHNLNIDDGDILEIREHIEDLSYNLADEMDKVKNILSDFDSEEINIEYIEERLYTYSRLKRKHATNTGGLLEKLNELKDKIAFFEDKDFVLNEKKKALDTLYNKAYDLAKKLHGIRSEKAQELEKAVISHCRDLMLENVRFKVMINENKMYSSGIDDVEFYISLNKGEDLKPLRNVASGGEISRLMLALKTVFTSLSSNSFVIFDEIDTGVSGKTALAIGQKMAEIAKNTQVLTITHLAAVAACASSHYYIYKDDSKGYSSTSIRKLNNDEIINELALISSSENSEAALQAARELYQSAQESIS